MEWPVSQQPMHNVLAHACTPCTTSLCATAASRTARQSAPQCARSYALGVCINAVTRMRVWLQGPRQCHLPGHGRNGDGVPR